MQLHSQQQSGMVLRRQRSLRLRSHALRARASIAHEAAPCICCYATGTGHGADHDSKSATLNAGVAAWERRASAIAAAWALARARARRSLVHGTQAHDQYIAARLASSLHVCVELTELTLLCQTGIWQLLQHTHAIVTLIIKTCLRVGMLRGALS